MLKSWHRTIGLIASVFLLLLTLTGLALMQTDDLNLDSRYVGNESVLNWYGVRPAPPPLSFPVGEQWVSQIGDRLYVDQKFATAIDGQLIGALPIDDEVLVATTKTLIMLTTSGEIAERLGPVEETPLRMGVNADGDIILQSDSGQQRFDIALGEIATATEDAPIRWSLEASAPSTLTEGLAAQYRGSGLSIERVLLDLHTGRLFGSFGVMLVNTASVLLLVLVISGFIMWVGRSR